jgi:hypothetical protein
MGIHKYPEKERHVMANPGVNESQMAGAFHAGRRVGFAVSAVSLSLVTFLSLLGAEKAILAMVLGVLAMRGAEPGTLAKRLGLAAIAIGGLFMVTAAVLLAVFWTDVVDFVELLDKLS